MNIFGKTLIPLFLAAIMLTSCNSGQSMPNLSETHMVETAIATVSTALAETQRAMPTAITTNTPHLLPTISFNTTPIPLPTVSFHTRTPTSPPKPPPTSTPLAFTDPSIPLSKRIVYYYLVGNGENPIPEGSVRAAHLLAPTYADATYTSDTAADLRTALEIVQHNSRNSWGAFGFVEAEIVDVTFRFGHAKVLLQGEYASAHPSAAPETPRMQILLTVFANPAVQTAAVSFNDDTIANVGVSDSRDAKPADYVFTRAEIETYLKEQTYVTPSPRPPTPTLAPFVFIDPSLPLPELSPDAINLRWITAYGLPGDQIVTKIHPTRDGGFILVGNTVIDNLSSALLLKLRTDGLIVWQKSLPQVTALDVLETSAGDFILAGSTHWIKFDSQGNILWQYKFGAISYHSGAILRLVEESNGNIVVESAESRAVFNADGEVQSFTNYYMPSLFQILESVTYPGNARDRSRETLWAGGGGGESTSLRFWVGKADLNSGWLKIFSFPPTPSVQMLFIQSTADGGALVGVRVYVFEGNYDLLVYRFSRDGSVRWQKIYFGSVSDVHAFETQSGDFILAGTVFYGVGAGHEDVWILRLDRDGNIRWVKLYGTAGSSPEGQEAIAVIQELSNGDLIFAGHTNGTGIGNQDMWILKTNAQGEIPSCGLALEIPEWLARTGVGSAGGGETITLEGVSLTERESISIFEDEQRVEDADAQTIRICSPSS